MIKGIKQGQVVVGKVKHPKVGMLPTNLILFAVEGEVEDLSGFRVGSRTCSV